MLARRLIALATLGTGAVALVAACSGAPDGAHPEAVGSSIQAITTTSIISRADEWVTAKLLYCQSPNGDPDPDPSCPSVCKRESNVDWDAYRSDCSGFVSWAWGLPAPGNTTSEFAPADTSVSYVIDGSELQPGDALNIPDDHIVLFVSWVTPGSEANFYEEPGCSATPDYAHAFSSAVTISGSSVTIAYEGATFTAIRYTGLSGGSGDGGSASDAAAEIPCTVTKTGEMGECLDTTVCAARGGVSTADYCPGPADIQCCTGIPDAAAAKPDAGKTIASDAGASTPPTPPTTPPTPEAGILPPAPPLDGGRPALRDASAPGDAPRAEGASGCGMAPLPGGPGDASWLFGIGAIALLAARRRGPYGAGRPPRSV
jgi:hypothetical protein